MPLSIQEHLRRWRILDSPASHPPHMTYPPNTLIGRILLDADPQKLQHFIWDRPKVVAMQKRNRAKEHLILGHSGEPQVLMRRVVHRNSNED